MNYKPFILPVILIFFAGCESTFREELASSPEVVPSLLTRSSACDSVVNPLARMTRYNYSDQQSNTSFPQTAALQIDYDGCHLPSKYEWRAIIPALYTSLYYESASSAQSIDVQEDSVDVMGTGVMATYTSSYKTVQGQTSTYALRLKGGDNRFYSAWKYEYADSQDSGISGKVLKISCRLLGQEGISTTMNQIMSNSFWNDIETVTRILPLSYGTYGWYWSATGSGTNAYCSYICQYYALSDDFQAKTFSFPVRLFLDYPQGGGVQEADDIIEYQCSYLKSLQMSDGAIKDNTSAISKITPYFSSYAALALLCHPEDSTNIAAAKAYINWYLTHLNTSEDDVEGSIYDYSAEDGASLGTYDSVDSYAAMFLIVAKVFASISQENLTWLGNYSSSLQLVFNALMAVIDENDGLTYASPSYPAKYLMDNCEVNAGLRACEWLVQQGLVTTSNNLDSTIETNSYTIKNFFYVSSSGHFKKEKNTGSYNWNTFYPDAACQLFPSIFGVISPYCAAAETVYDTFNEYYPLWSEGVRYDVYPWTMLCLAALRNNDIERRDAYLDFMSQYVTAGTQPSYWYSMEAANLVLAASASNPFE